MTLIIPMMTNVMAEQMAVTRGKVAYAYEASGSEPFGELGATLRGYVLRRAEAWRASGLHTLAEFRAFRRGWESAALDDWDRCRWGWL